MTSISWRSKPHSLTRADRLAFLGLSVGWFVLGAACAMELLGLSRFGAETSGLLLCAGLFVWFWSAVLSFFLPATRQRAPHALAIGLLGLLALLGTPLLRHTCRMAMFRRLASRSEPLVAALHAYEQRYAAAPPTLEALVTEFLPGVPSTGRWDYPAYAYSIEPGENHASPGWRLRVPGPRGLLNWDEFIYSPTSYGFDPVTRLGEWIYWHE